MDCLLTSSIFAPNTEELSVENGFLDRLKAALPNPCRALFICSDPDRPARTDAFAATVQKGFSSAGFSLSTFDVLDRRTQKDAPRLVREANCIILAGGHVPTQNRFFEEIGLKRLLLDFQGVLIGISAGSINAADAVYAYPEKEGEALDPSYQKDLSGLGLTRTMLLPHYQILKEETVDGLRLLEDIILPDSRGRTFYALVDGSYLRINRGIETICGEAYRIQDGAITRISERGTCVDIEK